MKLAAGLLLLTTAGLLAQPPGGPGQGPGGGSGDGIWLRNAYYGEAQTFDSCVGHQPGNGQYHHHANPLCLRAQLEDNIELVKTGRTGSAYREKTGPWTHSPILGWSFDGYPIYGPYGYSTATDPKSAVRRMKSSFRLRDLKQRTSLPDWALPLHSGVAQNLTSAQYGPDLTAQFPLGRYIEDFEYVAGLGDLDVSNGRFAITPEYPQGTYAYYITIEADGTPVFPYLVGLLYYGSVAGGNARTIPEGTSDYFNAGTAPAKVSTVPLLTSWATKNSQQPAQVVSNYNPAAGPKTTWPNDVPAGVTATGVTTPVLADTQRIRFSDTTVYVNANGLASYVMGPWFDPLQPGGFFGAYPTVQAIQAQFPRTPTAAATRTATSMGAIGLWVNGVAVFNTLDGASYSNTRATDQGGGLVSLTAVHVSAASSERGPIAQGALVTAYSLFGSVLATSTATADTVNWPTTLGGTTVTVKDSAGISRPAPIYYTSAGQVNYRIPDGSATGNASVTIAAGGGSATTNIYIASVYPNLFMADPAGAASGYVTRVRGGVQITENLAKAIDVSQDEVYLVLYGSGLGAATSATATVGGAAADVIYAGPQGTYAGLDQFNVRLPKSLAGKGSVDVVITAGDRPSNVVHVNIL